MKRFPAVELPEGNVGTELSVKKKIRSK